ncbi:Hypothetical protein HDN1F_13480 [gamma proteobacterium HdN1]|nr:Hypothetical protein HDN1F_13480 [gamma proteobacterium HdN1]
MFAAVKHAQANRNQICLSKLLVHQGIIQEVSVEYLIAIDFETTGLEASSAAITEIGAVKFKISGEIVDQFEMFAYPGTPIPVRIQELTGITDEMVTGCEPPLFVWKKFLDWADGANTFIAHNAPFEARFVRALYEKEGEMPNIYFIDTLQISRNRLPEESSYSLKNLVKFKEGEPHRALADAKACSTLYCRLASTYRNGKIPVGTYKKSIRDYKDYDEPTGSQLAYIEDLGGDVNSIKTRQEASRYIDELKAAGQSAHSKQREIPNNHFLQKNFLDYTFRDKVFIVIIIIFALWLIVQYS